jgi:hypothetical protein
MFRQRLRGISCLAGIGAVALAASAAHASLVASDAVSNYAAFVNFNAMNGGTGFGPWTAGNASGTSGGDFTWNADLTTPGSGQGFDIYNNGTQGSGTLTDKTSAVRPFTGALSAGQAFSFIEQLNNGSNPTNGGPSNLGFSLEDSTGIPLFDFHVQGGSAGYLLTDATQTGVTETTVPYNYHSIDSFSFAITSVTGPTANYAFTASGGNVQGGSQTFTGTISLATGGISQADIYNNNGGQGSDLQFDNLAITNVPEPVSISAMGLLAGSMLIRRRKPAN